MACGGLGLQASAVLELAGPRRASCPLLPAPDYSALIKNSFDKKVHKFPALGTPATERPLSPRGRGCGPSSPG